MVIGGDRSTVTGGNWSTVTGGDGSTVIGGDYSTVTGGNWSTVTGGDCSTVTGGCLSKVRCGLHGCIVIRDDKTPYQLVSASVDGVKIKADTWYQLDNNANFVECE
jgi:hypothetical protein